VTGSKTMLDSPGGRVLIDCGLFQGRKELRLRNWAPFSYPPESIDAVVLTHAHLDHCGYLPRLARLGFSGPILCTEPTRRLAEIVLIDSGRLQEEEARFANSKGYSKHEPAQPLYTEADARSSLSQFRAVDLNVPTSVHPGLDVVWHRAGHILGSATLELRLSRSDTVATFSGDLGTSNHPLLLPPEPIGRSDVIVTESTYGDTNHGTSDPDEVITSAVRHIVDRNGVLVIPAFAVDRTEVVLWHLDRLIELGILPHIDVYVDSPMASRALDVYEDAVRHGAEELRPEYRANGLFQTVKAIEVTSVEESKALNTRGGPMIIISASGMATGGRVVHHLAQRIGDSDNAVMLVGYQPPGTRGAALRNGARQLKMFGHYHPVRSAVFSVDLSAHADQSDLVNWVGSASPAPRMVLVNHGEASASQSLVRAIEKRFGLDAVVPRPGERVRLDPPPTRVDGPRVHT
jgi:metallo-beta-lactamase family protein